MKKIATIACICFCILTIGIFFAPEKGLNSSLLTSNILSYEQQTKASNIIISFQKKYFTEDEENNIRYMKIFHSYFERKIAAKSDTLSIQNKALIRYLIVQADAYLTYGDLPILSSASSGEEFVNEMSIDEIQGLATQTHNTIRTDNGLTPLLQSGTLHTIAQSYADRMCVNNLPLQHIDPDGNTAYDRIKAEEVVFLYYGENLAKWYTKVSYVLDGLMKSEWHRENIIHPKFTKIGIGHCNTYWVFVYTDK